MTVFVEMRKRKKQSSSLKPTASGEKVLPMRRKCGCKLKTLLCIIAIYLALPFVLRFVRPLQDALIYVNVVDFPLFTNLSAPGEVGLKATRSFYLHHENGERIGVWQIAPIGYHGKGDDVMSEEQYAKILSDGRTIVMYMHGNTGTRAMYHRVGVYKMLVNMGYHCIAFDYRGYGDSDGSATEIGLRDDARLVWNWIREHAPNAKVFIWGHSLGSAPAVHLTRDICSQPRPPAGLILDAPFTRMQDAAVNHIFSLPYWPIMFYLKYTFIDHIEEKFSTIDKISDVSCKILIIHGRGDIIVPYQLGKNLYEYAVDNRKPDYGEVLFTDCGDQRHRTNYLSPALPNALTKFIDGNNK